MHKITLFTGQWADMPLAELAPLAKELGYDGLELACWGDHFDVRGGDGAAQARQAQLAENGLELFAISNHLVGQAVCDRIDDRHREILPTHVWGDGDPEGVKQRAADEMIATAQAAASMGLSVVNGFTGSSIWHLLYSFPPVPPEWIDEGFADFGRRWTPILDAFAEAGVKFALEVHPSEIAFDIATAERALETVDGHPAFGFNFDPSHFIYQGVDPVAFIHRFADRIFHVHMKDVYSRPTLGEVGVFGGHTEFGDHRRAWDFRSLGRGSVDFEAVLRALHAIGYEGPLSVEWEDSGMDRVHGAREAAAFLRKLDFPKADRAFDSAFSSDD